MKEKQVAFSIPENEKAKFKVQLQYDSLTQGQFLKGIMFGYIEQDLDLMKFIAKLKEELKAQSRIPRNKVERNLKDRQSTKNKFALEDDEVEDIFDILEQEHPDL
jgi:dsDNA-specific endonuclease/ATPase MutS2